MAASSKSNASADLRPGRAGHQLMLRLPEALRDRIKDAADAQGRSMNAEIVATLVERYPEPVASFDVVVEGMLGLLADERVDATEGVEVDDGLARLEGILDRVRAELLARMEAHDESRRG